MTNRQSPDTVAREHRRLLGRSIGTQRLAVTGLFLLLCAETGLDLLAPQVIRGFIDGLQARSAASELVRTAVLFLGLVAVQVPIRIARTGASQHVAWTATNGLRSDLARHVIGLDAAFHNSHTPGGLLEQIEGDTKRLGSFFSDLVPGIASTGLLAVGILAALFLQDWRMAAMAGFFLAGFVLLHQWDQGWALPHYRLERRYATELSGFVEETAGAARDLHAAGATGYTLGKFHGLLRRHASQGVRAEVVTDAAWSVSHTYYALGIAAALVTGGRLFTRGAITVGAVYLLVHYLQMLHGPVAGMGSSFEELLRAQVSIERIAGLFAERSSLRGPGDAVIREDGPTEVRVEGVWFAYHPEIAVLRDISFSLAPGETLGLLGATGSGKSTLCRLLFRFYDAQKGTIRMDGFDVRDLDVSRLRRRVAVVTQNVELFRSSVRDNVTLFQPGIPDETIIEILGRLGLSAWLDALPQGLDTRVSPDGVGLSAGQAQLMAVARAFLKNPGLVILDEPSSRLDPVTESLLGTAVDSLLAGRTAIVIAHRLSTVQRVNTIMVLDQGQVKEHGSYVELAARPDSAFAALLRTNMAKDPV